MVKCIKVFSLFLIGSLIIPLFFAAQPAAAAPKDWEKIDTDETNVCAFIEEQLGEVFSFEECDESSGVEPSLNYEGASASLKTDASGVQSWRGRFSLNTENSDVSRGTAVYLPVCYNNGEISAAGDQLVMQESLEDGSQTYQEVVKPTWDQCFIGQSPALLKILHLEADIALDFDSPYFPDYLSINSSNFIMRGFINEYGLNYVMYAPTGNINGEGNWFVFLDPRKSSWVEAFPDYDFSDWIDYSQISRSSRGAYTDAFIDALSHNAEVLYGEDYEYSSYIGNMRFIDNKGTYPATVSMGYNFPSSYSAVGGYAYKEMPPPFEMDDHIGRCYGSFSGEWTWNPEASVCDMSSAFATGITGRGVFYDDYNNDGVNRADLVDELVYRTAKTNLDSSLFDTVSMSVDISKIEQGSAISYSLVEPSDTSVSGPIVEQERKAGIDEEAIKDAGGFTTPKEISDHMLDKFPSVNFTDCDLEGLGWFSCLVQLVQDIFEWVGNVFVFLIELIIPMDLDYFAWVRAIYGGFTNSDPFYYVYGTIEYSVSRFGGVTDFMQTDGMCGSIDSGFMNIDFCKLKGSGYSTAMAVFSAVIYIVGFLAIFRILYGFFAPKTDLSATVSPSTAENKGKK